jgi:serpin B
MSSGETVDLLISGDQAVQVVDLPYGGRAFSMMIVMPPDSTALDSLVAGLTLEQWDGWVAGLDSAEREVSLPKFHLVNDLLLNSTLAALGMSIAFDCLPPEMADFTRMHVPQELCITRVKHKSFVDVNEEGTEAAAVTSVEMGVTSAPQPIFVDRPFLFAIRENLSGTILFMGKITNPALLQ